MLRSLFENDIAFTLIDEQSRSIVAPSISDLLAILI